MARTIKVISERLDGKQLREEKARLERSRGSYIRCDGVKHVLGYNKVKQPDGTVREVPQQFQDDANINEAIQNANKGMMWAVPAKRWEEIFGSGRS